MGTDLKGTNLVGLSNCAEKLGFTSQAVRVENEVFISGKLKGEKISHRFIKLLLPQKKLFFYSILASILLTILGIVAR